MNAQGFFLGRRDEGVTGLGEEQSRRAVAGLIAWRPDRIICSPLMRCKTMIAEPAARELGIEAQVDERLCRVRLSDPSRDELDGRATRTGPSVSGVRARWDSCRTE